MRASYQRLKLMFDTELEFDMESVPGEGTTILIGIPFRTGGEG